MKKTKILGLITVFICISMLAGCQILPATNDISDTTANVDTSLPDDTSDSTDPPEPIDPYEEFLLTMEGTPQRMAVAYFGYFSHMDVEEFDENAEYAFSSVDPFHYMKNIAPELCEEMPFLLSIPDENIIGDRTGELYCIIPADKNASVAVTYAGVNEDGEDMSETLYQSADGEPIMVFCNTGWAPEMQIKIEETNGNSFVWIPALDNTYYVSMMMDEKWEEMVLDISPYAECLAANYRIMRENGYILPTNVQLCDTIWSADENFPYNQYYRIAFHENKADIYWKTDDGEEHEYLNAAYSLEAIDGVSILTLDLGGFAGVHRYNLLMDSDGYMLYTAVDSTDGHITHMDEKQYRFLYRDVSSSQ